MKKNTIILIVVAALVIVGLSVGGVFLIKNRNNKTENGTTEGTSWNFDYDYDDAQTDYTIYTPEESEPLTNEAGQLIEIVTDENGNTYESILETNAAGEIVTNASGEKVTVNKKPVTTTKKPSTTKNPGTTQKPNSGNNIGGISSGDKVNGSGNNNTIEVDANGNANIVKPDGTIALSYSYDAVGKYFYTDDDPWQRNFGFNRLYDIGAVFTVMYLDTIHVYYSHGDYDWMVQFWKGQYGFLFVGSEIGLYYKEPGKSTAHYNCAEEDMEIMMQMTLHREGYGELFTRPYKSHWWTTAFVPGKLKKFSDRSELTMIAKLTFKTEEEAILFCQGLEKRVDVDGNRFKPATSISKSRPETYLRKGATVDLVWRYLDDDRVNPTKPTTTTPTTTQKPGETTTKKPTTTEAPTTAKPIVTTPPSVDEESSAIN